MGLFSLSAASAAQIAFRLQTRDPVTGKIVLATDRIPAPTLHRGYVYNFWQDAEHVKGIWRRTPLASYATKSPLWETLLDLDLLAKQEKENWVWKGEECLAPEYGRCLLRLSRGGKDSWNNVVTACKRCNNRKAGQTPEQAGMELLAVPFTPTHAEYIYLQGKRVLADQMEFLFAHFPRHSPLHERLSRLI